MLGWIILGVILLLLAVLLLAPIRLRISYLNGELTYSMGYLFLRYPKRRKPKKTKAKRAATEAPKAQPAPEPSAPAAEAQKPVEDSEPAEGRKPAENGKPAETPVSSEKPAAPEEKPKRKSLKERYKPSSLEEGISLLRSVLNSSGKPMRMLCKGIAIRDLDIHFAVADPDAAVCAVRFGKVNIALYNALGWLCQFFRVRKKQIIVQCVYDQPESRYDASGCIVVTPFMALTALSGFMIRFWVYTKRNAA